MLGSWFVVIELKATMSKDSLALEGHAKLDGSSNYHLWKHMITQALNKEGLWFILKANLNKGKGVAPSNLVVLHHGTIDHVKTSQRAYKL